MEITNKHNLPKEVYDALCKNRYQGDDEHCDAPTDFSVSAIIAPIQQTILRRRHPGCNSEDAIDRVWTLFGHIAHSLLEEHGSDDAITEKRFYLSVAGRTISGQIDHYKDKKITDYKTTSAYKVKRKDFDDWQKQLNLYSFLCEENGYDVDSIRIVVIIRDWSEAGYAKDPKDYPKAPIIVLPLVKWSKEARRKYLDGRISLLLENQIKSDENLTPCTHKETWNEFKDWAVFKVDSEGNLSARASKTFQDREEATEYRRSKGKDYEVVERRKGPRRCISYCNVSSVCHQFKRWKEESNYVETGGFGAAESEEC